MEEKLNQKLQFLLGTGGFLFLMIITFFHRQPPLFDEVLFVPNVYLFEKHGLSREFLVNLNNQAPGPLYEFVHLFFKPLTHLQAPGIRLVNVFLFGMVILMIARIFTLVRTINYYEAMIWSLAIVGVPMVWQIAGLALTEMPAMFFAVFAVLLLIHAIHSEKRPVASTLFALAAGLCLGLAILGRSPFLTIVAASGILLLFDIKSAARWRTILLIIIVSLSICFPVFYIWGGLVPPQQSFVGKGFSIWHGLLAFAYGGLLAVLIAPGWFFINRTIILSLLLTYIGLVIVNIYFVHYEYKPFYKAVATILPDPLLKNYPLLVSPMLATLSIYFIVTCLVHLWRRRSEPFFVFFLVSGMLLLASNFKVTHLFSTRYVGQAAAFFVLVASDYDKSKNGRLIRLLIGMVIGVISLETYILFG
jgi:4-amino-4-deoxy-L-arabinose transferase-like glycosyltransferase